MPRPWMRLDVWMHILQTATVVLGNAPDPALSRRLAGQVRVIVERVGCGGTTGSDAIRMVLERQAGQ